ncbi:MAG: GNAT family N-acetyltransferase [Propioniciclava sp.]
MNEVRIRSAVPADAAVIAGIYNAFVHTSTATWDTTAQTVEERRRWLIDRAATGDTVLVAERAGEILGYAGWAPFRDKPGYAHTREHTVYVAASAQGAGVGTRLLTGLIAAAGEAGVHVLLGVISADNTGSLRLHQRLGFTEVGRLPQTGRKFGRWLDLVFVQLTFDERAAAATAGRVGEPVG